jgi:phosphoglycerate dehydrogenase-like enzyme
VKAGRRHRRTPDRSEKREENAVAVKVVLVAHSPDAPAIAQEIAPPGFALMAPRPGSPEYQAALGDVDYLISIPSWRLDDVAYRAAPRLKLVQLISAGYDDCDVEAARRAGVPIATNGGANAIAVAEHAIMLMLAVSRRLIWQHTTVAAGRWRGNQPPPRLFELNGKTLGIIGLGRIGKKVARLASAFDMRIHYYDIVRLGEHEEDALGVRFRLLPEILAASDIVSLHVPLNASTRHLIGTAELARMPPAAVLINTCRGPVVDEAALFDALAGGRLAGAGLDVFAEEPPPSDHPLFSLDNVVLTPHFAGPTFESFHARLRNAFDNIERMERGERPLWVIPELRDTPAARAATATRAPRSP